MVGCVCINTAVAAALIRVLVQDSHMNVKIGHSGPVSACRKHCSRADLAELVLPCRSPTCACHASKHTAPPAQHRLLLYSYQTVPLSFKVIIILCYLNKYQFAFSRETIFPFLVHRQYLTSITGLLNSPLELIGRKRRRGSPLL